MRRLLAGAAIAAAFLLWIVPIRNAAPVSASATTPFSFSWSGGLTSPVPWSGSGASSTWDVLAHKRGLGEDMQATMAQHGADCAPPPATHMITTLADSVYICRNHLMTSVTDAGYGADALTPDHMADFASGESVISFSVSTLHTDARDYFDVWITPFASNLVLPLTDAVDVQGPPQYAVRVRGCVCGNNTDVFTASVFNNFVETALPSASGTPLQTMLPPSAVTRTGFELHISQNHIKFGVPSIGLWWVDTAANIPFTQGVVQIIQHSYDACKDQTTTTSNPCVADTWHWSNFGISQSDPFTIINGTQRWASAQSTTVNFGAPAPANAFLRFEALSGGISFSTDGGHTFQAAHRQPIIGDHGTIHPEHFTPYFTPIPAGTSSVVFSGQSWFGGTWEVRDPSIWAASGLSPIIQVPAGNPPTQAPGNPPANPGSGSTGGSTSGGSSSPSGGSKGSTGGGAESGNTGSSSDQAAPPLERAQQIAVDLVAAVNPRHDPVINVVIVLLIVVGVAGIYRVIRG
jgi:hypothetical protein